MLAALTGEPAVPNSKPTARLRTAHAVGAAIIEQKSGARGLTRTVKRLLLFVLLLSAWTQHVHAGEKGWFGFGVTVKVEGFFLNPNLTSVTVDVVQPRSPAAEKAIAVGDEVLQLEGTDVPGAKALKLRSMMQKEVGQTLHLKLKRPNGETYSVALVAAKSPK